ncbi:hypothetical protein NIES2101_00330 [Calothrix sp. HK-06]|nr:hypothetical protein NIES2101_00330 [Calothrix sp. HK-06]
MKQEINLFSKKGLTILGAITIPITVVMVVALYFPSTWNNFITTTGLARNEETKAPTATNSTTPQNRKFLGTAKTGYELWTDGNCVFVKGARMSDIGNFDSFKDNIKSSTGYKCVLFE